LNKLTNKAIKAKKAGDDEAFEKYSELAFHLAADLHGHEDTNYVLHGIQKIAGFFQDGFTGKDTVDPDSPDHPTFGDRLALAKLEVERVREQIESGVPIGESVGPPMSFDKTYHVDTMSEAFDLGDQLAHRV
jgi:hypothetical protein